MMLPNGMYTSSRVSKRFCNHWEAPQADSFYSGYARILHTSKEGYETVHAADRCAASTSHGMCIDLILLERFAAAVAAEKHHFRWQDFLLVVKRGWKGSPTEPFMTTTNVCACILLLYTNHTVYLLVCTVTF